MAVSVSILVQFLSNLLVVIQVNAGYNNDNGARNYWQTTRFWYTTYDKTSKPTKCNINEHVGMTIFLFFDRPTGTVGNLHDDWMVANDSHKRTIKGTIRHNGSKLIIFKMKDEFERQYETPLSKTANGQSSILTTNISMPDCFFAVDIGFVE